MTLAGYWLDKVKCSILNRATRAAHGIILAPEGTDMKLLIAAAQRYLQVLDGRTASSTPQMRLRVGLTL